MLHPGSPRRTRLRNASFGLAAAALAIGLTCVAAEIGLRIGGIDQSYLTPLGSFFELDPRLGIRGKPAFTGRFRKADFDVRVVHDDLGFRQHENQPRSATCAGTVYVLGDSFTWGYGVGQGAVFTDLMQQELPDRPVRNFAVCASGTVQQYAIFERHVRQSLKRDDLVVVAFFANDFDDNTGKSQTLPRLYAEISGGEVREVPPKFSRLAAIKKQLKEASCLASLGVCAWDNVRPLRSPARLPSASIPAAADAVRETSAAIVPVPADARAFDGDDAAMTITEHYLTRFRDDCQKSGARLLLVYIPDPSEYGEHDTSQAEIRAAERQALLACATELGIMTCDLLPTHVARDHAAGRLTFANDWHWNEQGHRLASRAVSQAVRNLRSTATANETSAR
jgi:lysophospholipase L1-like esterase